MMGAVLREQLGLLPEYLGRHVILTVCALAMGIAISLPVGILVSRNRRLQDATLAVASVIQTIPGLALLALMVPLLGMIGFVPAFIAFVLYSMLPILRNTVTGIAGVDPGVVEAARGIGMYPRQVMLRVRLPIALPVIVAGIRTATVWTVGMVTLSTVVGATSLGNYIFSGLQTQNNTAVIVGCVAAAGLALVLDGLIHLCELALVQRRKTVGTLALAGLTLVIAGGALAPYLRGGSLQTLRETLAALTSRSDYTIGAKGFTEQYILGDLMAGLLGEAGYRAEVRGGMGSTVVFDALAAGQVDAYVDYTGTLWSNAMGREENPGPDEVYAQVKQWLDDEHDIGTLGRLGFENAYALCMRRDEAERLGITSIADLAGHATDLALGTDYEFLERTEWAALQRAYDLPFAEKRSMDPALMYRAIAEEQVDVITAFSTDGRILVYDLVVLDDPRNAIPPYDALLLIAPGRRDDGAFKAALQPLVGAIGNEVMRTANKLVDKDNRTIAAAAGYVMEASGE